VTFLFKKPLPSLRDLVPYFSAYPRLTSWANICRPYGATRAAIFQMAIHQIHPLEARGEGVRTMKILIGSGIEMRERDFGNYLCNR